MLSNCTSRTSLQCLLLLGGMALSMSAGAALTQAAVKPASKVTFPAYTADQVTDSAVRWQQEPRAEKVLLDLKALYKGLDTYCSKGKRVNLSDLQTLYGKASVSWGALTAAVFGPIDEFDTLRLIDFQPTDPAIIHNAASSHTKGEAQMILINSAGKGFPALSWLLFDWKIKPGTDECAYSLQVAHDIEDTVDSLNFTPDRSTDPSEAKIEASKGLDSYFSQLVGGVHDLAWNGLLLPELRIKNGEDPQWESGDRAQADAFLQESWKALRELLVLKDAGHAPDPAHEVIPVEAYLLGHGKASMAQRLHQAVLNVDSSMAHASTYKPNTVMDAAKSVKALKALLEGDVSDTLGIKVKYQSLEQF